MEEMKKEEELEQAEANKAAQANIYQRNVDKPFVMSKPELFANPNRSIGKWMKATHQTIKPRKPKKKR
ncbi:MAG: hypothetical protein ACD_2C00013G0010 [uncultured bacterium (gcode 4)]|uniref:Uncharacterized protein n=1 Tax=uncultured bacterium (gcode 4) TaxID=1234023 RepID=K2G7F1_9BACT|nr:MAG: hypothetical protein ACD_2C00013G0010 [uncultured bacterium (gcode 4)]